MPSESSHKVPVLVTGGAGYIGSHAVLALTDAGWPVAVIDNLTTGFRWAVPDGVAFYEGDIADPALLARIFAEQGTRAIMHFAGSIVVPDSVSDPLGYYLNNTVKSRALLEAAVVGQVPHFIFSSTAATYGMPEVSPVGEDTPTVPINPYGMSKLMTAAVVFRALKDGKLKLEDQFLVSVNAWRTGGAPSGTSAMMIPVNTRVSLDELLQGLIVQSGNDAAIALAEGMAGNEAAFAKMMDAEARQIGLKASSFRNATGLPSAEHRMSVKDLAVLARHLIRSYPEQYAYFGQKSFNYRKHKFTNRNPLLFANIGVDGLKTGHIKESGYGMVVSAVVGERRLIAVLCGLRTAEERKKEAQKLIEHGFANYPEFKVFDAGEVVGRARVWGGSQMYVPLVGAGDVATANTVFARPSVCLCQFSPPSVERSRPWSVAARKSLSLAAATSAARGWTSTPPTSVGRRRQRPQWDTERKTPSSVPTRLSLPASVRASTSRPSPSPEIFFQ